MNPMLAVHSFIVPSKGLSEVIGIVSATMFKKTVKESSIVTPKNHFVMETNVTLISQKKLTSKK